MALRDRLEELLLPVIESLGYELVLLEYQAQLRSSLLRIYIDKAEGRLSPEAAMQHEGAAMDGITVEDCETVSRAVSALLEVEDPISAAYNLEVSSPGMDRPLVKLAHYERFMGENIKVQLLAPINRQRRFQGKLIAADAEQISLLIDKNTVILPMSAIEKARIVPDYSQYF